MRSFTLSALAVVSFFASEALATPPACLLACAAKVIKASSTCNALNKVSCVCENAASDIKSCLESTCPNGDADTAYSSFESACSAVGASVGSSSSSASSSSPASSSSSSSSSSSATPSSSSTSSTSSSSSSSTSSAEPTTTSSSSSAEPTTTSSSSSSSSAEPTTTTAAASSSVEPTTVLTSSVAAAATTTTAAVVTQSGEGLILNAPIGALVGAAAFGILF